MNRSQRIAIWVLTLIGLLAAWKLFGQGFGNFRTDQPFLARNYTSTATPCTEGNVTNVAGLTVWLKGDDLAYLDNGTTLATNGATIYLWKDSSTNANNVVQADSDKRPWYDTNGLNGHAALVFTNDYMDRTYAAALTHPNTYFAVYSFVSSTANPGYLFDGIDGAYGDSVFYISGGTTAGNNGDSTMVVRVPWSGTNFGYDTIWINGASSKSWTNGTPAHTGSLNNIAPVGLRIGNNRYLDQGGTFRLCELIIYNAAVSDASASNICCYLKNKYGL